MNKTNAKELLYYNEFGGFDKQDLSYVICTEEKTTPTPWSHIIANENFGTIVTSDGGGYTWYGNSRENKLTTWSNDVVTNKPSETIRIRNGEKEFSAMPRADLHDYEIRFSFGYAMFKCEKLDIESELIVYVPIRRNEKIYSLKLKNLTNELKAIEVCFEAEPVLGVNREYTRKHLKFKNINNGIAVSNLYREIYKNDVVEFLCEKEIEQEVWNENIILKSKFNLLPNEEKCVNFKIKINNRDAIQYWNIESDLEKIKSFWEDKTDKLKVNTPLTSLNIMMNGWLQYQTLTSRLWGRTSFYQAGGAFGFRDQLQDVLMFNYLDSELTRKQILYHAKHQFKEGDVLHWWHPEKDNGIRTRYSDDLLWLPYVLAEYIKKTGDYSILKEEVSYVEMSELGENENEKYEVTNESLEKDSLYVHAIKAIDRSLTFGINGLPNMGSGDWNDGMNNIKGQSVWLGFFLGEVLQKFIPICEYEKDFERVEKYKKTFLELKDALNKNAWDGKWFKRAFFQNGEALGSEQNDECKIDGISQSWAVISNMGDKEKCIEAMKSVDDILVDKENMLIKLLTPPFSKATQNPGYIKAYMEGVRENGGQYTHGAIWSLIANAMLKNNKRVYDYYKILNPIEHARTKDAVYKYKVEPYVIAADVYAAQGMIGRGGWTWYTGSSSWFYLATLEYLLGLKIEDGFICINPNIPNEWESYNVTYSHQNAKYNFTFYNKESDKKDELKIYVNNKEITGNKIPQALEGEQKIDIII